MYEKETDFCGCRRIDGCRGCDCLYGKLPTGSFDLLNANIEALAQDESLDPGESYSGTYEISVICTRCGATLIRCMPCYEPCPSTCTPTSHSC